MALIVISLLVISVQSADRFKRYKFKQDTSDEKDSYLDEGAYTLSNGVNGFHKRLGCEIQKALQQTFDGFASMAS